MTSPSWLSFSLCLSFAPLTAVGLPGDVSPKTALVVFGVFVVSCGLILRAARRKVKITGTPQCTLYQMPVVFDRLEKEGEDGSFAAFTFQPPGTSNRDDAINIQFSIENGRIGLDWCLLGAANIRDKDKLERFITAQGYKARLQELNEVQYLRVEEGDLTRLCQSVITGLYSLRPTAKLDMVVEGFSWP